jgi:Stress responsive A/B Barrel Domain
MITHVVLFKLKDRSPSTINATRERMALIEGHIPTLLTLQVGINAVPSDRAYDIALVATFNSLEDLRAFQMHPVHVTMFDDVKARFDTIAAVDYEI